MGKGGGTNRLGSQDEVKTPQPLPEALLGTVLKCMVMNKVKYLLRSELR
jgi:hypothetical protein